MNKIIIMILFSLIASCAFNQKKEEPSDATGEKVEVPVYTGKKNEVSLFFNTQKIGSKSKNGFTYELYYGTGGRYIVKVISKSENNVSFASAEGTLTIENENDPETISLATTKDGLFSGFGLARNGIVRIKFILYVPESKYTSLINEEFEYIVNIIDVN